MLMCQDLPHQTDLHAQLAAPDHVRPSRSKVMLLTQQRQAAGEYGEYAAGTLRPEGLQSMLMFDYEFDHPAAACPQQ